MERIKELGWNLGFQVLVPRFFLYSIVPLIFLGVHQRDAWSIDWFPVSGWLVAVFGGLFLLNVGADLAVSRYLRLHQTDASPYKYSRAYDSYTNKPFFRIIVKDKTAFSGLIKFLKAEHKGKQSLFGSPLTI